MSDLIVSQDMLICLAVEFDLNVVHAHLLPAMPTRTHDAVLLPMMPTFFP